MWYEVQRKISLLASRTFIENRLSLISRAQLHGVVFQSKMSTLWTFLIHLSVRLPTFSIGASAYTEHSVAIRVCNNCHMCHHDDKCLRHTVPYRCPSAGVCYVILYVLFDKGHQVITPSELL